MSYRVFARKYRPQTFEEVVGQDHITRTLRNAISANRLAQAYLFVGPRGIGKTSTARILAKALNCIHGPTVSPCGVCDACREIEEGRSLDVIEIDGASNNGVENIRDLRDNAAYAPARGPFKIYLIDEVHMLSTGAFNALLKTLEEPPPHVKFIFATTEAQKLPATITSRCQRFDLRRIPTDLIAKHLAFIAEKESITLSVAAAQAIARGAEGGLRDAESMLDQMVAFCGSVISADDVLEVFGFTAQETVSALVERLFARDAENLLRIVTEQSEAGKDLSRLTTDVIAHLRDVLVSQARGAEGEVPQEKILDLIEHFGEAETRMKWVADKKLQLDVALIKALHLLDEASLTDVIAKLTELGGAEASSAVVNVPPRPAKPLAPKPAPVAETPPPPAKAEEVLPVPPVLEESTSLVASQAWDELAGKLAKTSMIRFGWLREGVFQTLSDTELGVRFPGSAREASSAEIVQQGLKELETQLQRKLGLKVRLVLSFDAESFPPEATAPPSTPTAVPDPMPEAPGVSAMDDFRNDPLIQKALEVFKGTLQTTSP